jgi:hypothetical protein
MIEKDSRTARIGVMLMITGQAGPCETGQQCLD